MESNLDIEYCDLPYWQSLNGLVDLAPPDPRWWQDQGPHTVTISPLAASDLLAEMGYDREWGDA